jgi:hypothetical protein
VYGRAILSGNASQVLAPSNNVHNVG